MDSSQYLKSLQSSNVDHRKGAIESGYIPKNKSEVNATVEGVLLAGKSSLQIHAINLFIEKVPYDVALPGYMTLAIKSHIWKVRKASIHQIKDDKSKEVTKILLLATWDGNIEVRSEAIKALEGRGREEVLSLLKERIEKPDKGLFPDFVDRKDEIKKAAINSIGTKGNNELINYLVDISLKNPEFRPEAKASLIRIGTSDVIDMLLSVVEGTNTDEDEITEIDRDTNLFIAQIINIMKPQKEHLDRYRPFLCEQYKADIITMETELSDILISVFNEEIGECLIELLEANKTHHDITNRILDDLISVPIPLSFPFWINVFERPEEHIHQYAVNKLTEKLTESLNSFPRLLTDSLNLGDVPAHQPEKLPQVVINLVDYYVKDFSDALVPLVRDTEDIISEIAKRYIKSIWQHTIDEEDKEFLLDHLLRKGYFKRKDGRNFLGLIVIEAWNRGEAENRETIYKELIRRRLKTKTTSVMNAIDELLCALAEKVTSPGIFAKLVVNDLLGLTPRNKLWEPLIKTIKYCPAEDSRMLLLEGIRSKWNKPLMVLVIDIGEHELQAFYREILTTESYEIPDDDKAWVIGLLGKYKAESDFPLISSYITTENPEKIQVSSIRALGNLPWVERIESSLIRALQSPVTPVVKESIITLGDTAIPSVSIVSALHERTQKDIEDDESIRKLAKIALELITNKHLNTPISKETEKNEFEKWLRILRHIGVCDCAKILDDLLAKHADPEHADRRILIVNTLSKSTIPEDGIRVVNKYITNERVPQVKDAMRVALDKLEGHPDRADFSLIEQVIGQPLDRNDLLGSFHLGDVFSRSITITALREDLRRAIDIQKDNDSLVEQFDAISDVLIRDLFNADKKNLDPEGKIREDAHENRIGKLQSHYPDISLAANSLHNLRKVKVKGPHSFNQKGAVRSGVDDQDRQRAIDAFRSLFIETIKALRKIKESNK